MKKILFVLHDVNIGGSATSLLNLLELMRSQGNTVDLFLMEHNGAFLDRSAEVANLLPEDEYLGSIRCTKDRLKKYGVSGLLNRCFFVLAHHLIGGQRALIYALKRSAKKLTGYDVVISYQEGMTTKFVQFIDAPKRVAWCHMDYDTFSKGVANDIQREMYRQYDEIACVSHVIKASLEKNLDNSPEKIHVVYNTLPPDYIRKKARQLPDNFSMKKAQFTFISMGRFVKRKCFDRIVIAAKYMKEMGVDCIWYIMGNGEEFTNIQNMVNEYGLEDVVKLIGAKSNPFPYIAQADCYIMSSSSEGQPMVMNEALTLGIPVISTDFPSAKEVVQDGKNGLIGENSDKGLCNAVERYVLNKELRDTIHKNADLFIYDNSEILNQVNRLIEL